VASGCERLVYTSSVAAYGFHEDNPLPWQTLVDCALERRQDTWRPMALAFRTQTLLQMAMLGNQHGKTIGFDSAKREPII